jgi:hypothetical protein
VFPGTIDAIEEGFGVRVEVGGELNIGVPLGTAAKVGVGTTVEAVGNDCTGDCNGD